ncbi:MAG: RHS repeat-associated core domain-containing protein, partial [Planctomycetia bacterium]|nr:RHS repeat-associated core domain-containing protein [Planctomycetia bacterium]
TYVGDGLEKLTYIYSKTNEVTVIDAVGNRSVISYDMNGNIARTIGSNGLVTGYTYDLFGRTSRVSLYDERNYSYSYNEYGNLISVADADGYSVYYGYDELGNTISVTDKRGITTEYLRDAKGNLTALVYADGSTEAYEYDAKGNVISQTDRMGHVTKYTYDGYSRLTRAEYYDGSYIAYTYDDNGNTVAIDENGDITSMTYDGYNNLIFVTYPDGRQLIYTYDEYGRMTSVIDGEGDGTGYLYDEYGRTSAVTDQDGGVLTRYDYNADSSIYAVFKERLNTYTRYTYSNGLLKSIYNYGADDSVQSFFEYTYDRFGNISMMKTVEGIWTYEYDVVGQLASVVSPSGEKTAYTYDLSGNKTSVTVNGISTAYEANRLNQVVKIGDMSLYYDANGNLIRTVDGDIVTDYEYDVYGKLIRVSVSGTETAAYAYDAFGNRSKVTADGVTTEYLNSPTGLGYAVAAYRNGQKTTYSWANGLVASKSGENTYFYSFNHLGSVIDMTDASGAVVNHYAYDPYGLITERSESVFNPFRYVGQYGIMDDDNGLWYVRARYVSQLSETFITVDPLGQYADLNVYRYAGNKTAVDVDINGKINIDFKQGIAQAVQFFIGNKKMIEEAGKAGKKTILEISKDSKTASIGKSTFNRQVVFGGGTAMGIFEAHQRKKELGNIFSEEQYIAYEKDLDLIGKNALLSDLFALALLHIPLALRISPAGLKVLG